MNLIKVVGLALVTVLLVPILLDLVKGEIRGRLDRLPHGLLRIARRRLRPELRASRCDEEWQPELDYILTAAEGLPLTRLLKGIRYAVCLLHGASAVGTALEDLDNASWVAIERYAAAQSPPHLGNTDRCSDCGLQLPLEWSRTTPRRPCPRCQSMTRAYARAINGHLSLSGSRVPGRR